MSGRAAAPGAARATLPRVHPMLWVGLLAWIGFAVWSATLMSGVEAERAAIEERVGWLIDASAVESALEAGDVDDARAMAADLRRRVYARAPRLAEAAASLEVGVDTGRLDAVRDFVSAVRRQNGELSARLGSRWDALGLLVAVSLSLGAIVLGLLGVVDHRRRVAETWRRAYERAMADVRRQAAVISQDDA